MTTYCAPCLADLALVRDAVTTVSGTAACVAHAVLLTHPGDTPQRRLSRLSDLRAMAEAKLPTASAEDVPAIELLVQEYALAGAMDMTVPLRDLAGDRTPRPPKNRRQRGRERERGPRPEGGAPAGETPAGDETPGASGEAETSAPDPSGPGEERAPAQAETSAPEPSGAGEERAPAQAETSAPEPSGRDDVAQAPVAE